MAGTSTGGLIAGLLGVPAQPSGRPAWSARDIQDFYVENAATMFALPLRQRIRSVTGLFGERYDSTGFDRALERALGPRDAPSPAMLSDLLRPTVIPTYNVTTAEPYFFKQHEAARDGGLDFALHDLARATAAAPNYFESMLVQSGGTPLGACVDGGVFANNPTMCAYAEARGAFGFGARKLAVLSLGTATGIPSRHCLVR